MAAGTPPRTPAAGGQLSWHCDAGVGEWHARCRPSEWSRCDCWCHDPATVCLTSFGYGHSQPPADAHVVVDVRDHFKDPHVNPRLRHLDGYDEAVAGAVMGTTGIPELINAIVATARAFRLGPQPGPVRIAIGCVGGAASAVIAMQAADRLWDEGIPAFIEHRDMFRPVIARRSAGTR
jgi:UPF0042 nucleotide-binding protein